MKINLAIIISLPILLIGLFTNQLYLWIPLSVLIASTIDLFTRQWVHSNRLGNAQALSSTIKLLFALIGFYATIGQLACITLLIWWFAF